MSNDGRAFASGSKRRPRSQREPAGGGDNGVSVMDAPSPAVSGNTIAGLVARRKAEKAQLIAEHHKLLDAMENGRSPEPPDPWLNGPSKRDADGWLVSPPPLEVFAAAALGAERTASGTEVMAPNKALLQIRKWLEDMFASGASQRDLERARYHIASKLGAPRPGTIVRWLRDHCLDGLEAKAGRRDYEQVKAREEAEFPANALRHMRTWLAQEERQADEAYAEASRRSEVVAKRRREIESWLQQHPHLKPSEAKAA